MFAGLGPNGVLSGTFLWNGHNWAQEKPKTHPSPRYFHSMAYDGGARNCCARAHHGRGFRGCRAMELRRER
jgi:hypothetical protein